MIKSSLLYETFELRRVHALGCYWNLVAQDGLFRFLRGSLATLHGYGFVPLSKKTGYTGRATPRQDLNSNHRGKK